MKIRPKPTKPKHKPKLTVAMVTKWMKQFKAEEGYYPSVHETKGVPDQPFESWTNLNGSLVSGHRGLPGGSSLAKIRNKLVGLAAVRIHVIPTETREVEPPRTVPLVADDLKHLIPQLDVMDRGILTRFLEGEKQHEIGELYGITQAAVSYRIKRSVQRLEYLAHLNRVPLVDFREGLIRLDVDPETQKILLAMRRYACQTRVAEKLQCSQGKVRHRIHMATKGLQPRNLGDLEVMRQIELLRDNPNIMSSNNYHPAGKSR